MQLSQGGPRKNESKGKDYLVHFFTPWIRIQIQTKGPGWSTRLDASVRTLDPQHNYLFFKIPSTKNFTCLFLVQLPPTILLFRLY